MSARILLIEDTEINLALMSYLLEAFGYSVEKATDGEIGLQRVRSNPPDLIICDIQMPTKDGYEVARELKADPVLKRIPLIAVSALAMVGDREKIIASGFDGYISKPIEPEKFVGEVVAFLDAGLRAPLRQASPEEAPETEAKPSSNPAKSAAALIKNHALLLVVDDSEMELWLMHSVFDPSGYNVRLAGGVDEALPLARTIRPDLIICDVMMPGSSGFDMLAAVKADPALRDIAVVLITSGSMDATDRERALAAGALRLISRPIEPHALLAEIDKCLAEIDAKS